MFLWVGQIWSNFGKVSTKIENSNISSFVTCLIVYIQKIRKRVKL